MDNKLKPCPFCGSVPKATKHTISGYWICCPSSSKVCKVWACTAYLKTEQEAIEAWNTRKGENQIENNIQAVAEVLGLNKGEENG